MTCLWLGPSPRAIHSALLLRSDVRARCPRARRYRKAQGATYHQRQQGLAFEWTVRRQCLTMFGSINEDKKTSVLISLSSVMGSDIVQSGFCYVQMQMRLRLTSGYLSREQLVLVLNLTTSNLKVSKMPPMLSRWLAWANDAAPTNAASTDVNLNIFICECLSVWIFAFWLWNQLIIII